MNNYSASEFSGRVSAGGASPMFAPPAPFRFLTGMLPSINETNTAGQHKNTRISKRKLCISVDMTDRLPPIRRAQNNVITKNDREDEII